MSYKEIKSFEQECREKDAEIERQGKAIRKLEECNEYLLGRVLENNQLITELCDALESSASHDTDWARQSNYLEIVQRAREATR